MDFGGYLRYTQFVRFVAIFAFLGIAFYCDRHKRIPVLGIGIFIGGIFTGFSAPAHSGLSYGLPDVLATAFIVGANVPLNSLLADYYPPEVRGKVYALLGLAGALAGTIIPFIAGRLVDTFGWRPLYLITAVPISLVGLLVLVRLREPVRGYMERRTLGVRRGHGHDRGGEPLPSAEAWRTIFGIRTLRRLFIARPHRPRRASACCGPYSAGFFFEEYGLDAVDRAPGSSAPAGIVRPASAAHRRSLIDR